MARRSNDKNQFSLFDISPLKPVKTQKRMVSQVPFVHTKKEPIMYIIGYKDGIEKYHQTCELSKVDWHNNFQLAYGNYTFKIYGRDDYWEKYKAGGFELGGKK